MALLGALITGPPAINRHSLSREFCWRIGWPKPDSGLKDIDERGDDADRPPHHGITERLLVDRFSGDRTWSP